MKNIFKTVLLLTVLLSTKTLKAQVPLLYSYPAATSTTPVIFLDFDGHTVSGTSWNYNGPIYCGASGLDNAGITTVFERVAEDYRPFTINVTTDSTKYLAAPATKRMRVIITVTSDWYGSAGGTAFVGSFSSGDNTPCFVFSALLNYNVKNIAEAAAHEAGHTLGLYHQSAYTSDCIKTSDYNYGQGVGEIGWAPIMGAGYYQNLTLWNNGPNSYGCTNYQNDLSIITANNGVGYRADDYGSSMGNSTTAATVVNNHFDVSGIITQSSDQDVIKFTQPTTGRFLLSAVPYSVGSGNSGSDLDLQVSLYSSNQTLLNVFNPGTLLSSVIDTTLNAGNYYLKIEGKGNMYAPNYASLGSYSLSADLASLSTLPLRKLELHGEIVSDKHRLNWIIDADEAIIKQVLEISTDGRTFTPLTQSATDVRTFTYRPYANTTAQYRLNVTFDNGHQYYSNIITLRNTGTSNWPKLLGNVTTNSVLVNSPGNYNYAIYEFSGKAVSKGQLTNGVNNIDASAIAAGTYLIRFSNASEQWSEKFVKQ